MDVEQIDPDKRPWVYSCDGRKVYRFENGEPDYTREWKPEDKVTGDIYTKEPYYVGLP